MSNPKAPRFTIRIGDKVYSNHEDPAPADAAVEYGDLDAGGLTLSIFDMDEPTGELPPGAGSVDFEAWAGWENEEAVKIFSGRLYA